MGLVDDYQIPARLLQSGQDVLALGQIERGDDLLLVRPLVDAELVADVVAHEYDELLVELLAQFPLPLERQVCRTDDEDSLGEPPQLEFADEQAGHDGLARAGVVGQQKSHAGELQEVLVDGFELVRERIHPRDGQPEVGIELVGDAEGVCLQSQPEQASVAAE